MTNEQAEAVVRHKWNRLDRPRECTVCGHEDHDGSGIGAKPCTNPTNDVAQLVGRLSAMSRTDMLELAVRLLDTRKADRPFLAAWIIKQGLMIPRQGWVRFLIWLSKRRHGFTDYQAWAVIFSRAPRIADEFLTQTAEWITFGKEASGRGVGGFNQAEVDKLCGALQSLRATPNTDGGEG